MSEFRGGYGPSSYAPPPPRRPDPQRICGVNAVRALFLRRPEAVQRLHYLAERRPVAGPLCKYLARHQKAYREVLADELERIAGTEHHGGIVAIADPRRASPIEGPPPAILFAAPVLLVLDGIGNPHNLGAIARAAAFFGAKALLLSGDSRQADLSDAAFRTSEGGLEHLAVYRADDLGSTLRRLSGQLHIVGAASTGGVAPAKVARQKPIALVLGAEETGLSPNILACCAERVTLPGSGLVESLNVAAATAVLLHAFLPEQP